MNSVLPLKNATRLCIYVHTASLCKNVTIPYSVYVLLQSLNEMDGVKEWLAKRTEVV